MLALTGDDTNGYAASVTIFLPITATYDASGMGAPPGAGGPTMGCALGSAGC